jgi:uncharacterized protein (TIGR00251 family)
MSPTFSSDTSDGCILNVRIHPGARKNAITGTHDNALKISLTTPPVDGRANEALIAFLADALQIPKSRIDLLTGQTSRTKTLRITGKSAAEVQAALDPTLTCSSTLPPPYPKSHKVFETWDLSLDFGSSSLRKVLIPDTLLSKYLE